MATSSTALPEPGPSGVDDHVQMSRWLLEQVPLELERGHRLQASEKVWGGVAHALKAIAVQRGWRNRQHFLLRQIKNQVFEELAQSDSPISPDRHRHLDALFDSASDMHVNFYQNEWESSEVARALANAEELVAVLDTVRQDHPGRFTVRDRTDQLRLGHLLGTNPDQFPVGSADLAGFAQHNVDA